MLPKISECARNYDGKTKYMSFLIKDDGLLKKKSGIKSALIKN